MWHLILSKHTKGNLAPRVSQVTVLDQRDIPGSLSVLPLRIEDLCFHNIFIITDVGSVPLRAERRRREARHEIFTTPKLVTARRSILGPPAEGRPGPSRVKSCTCLVVANGIYRALESLDALLSI